MCQFLVACMLFHRPQFEGEFVPAGSAHLVCVVQKSPRLSHGKAQVLSQLHLTCVAVLLHIDRVGVQRFS
jgi:hypothetical protein